MAVDSNDLYGFLIKSKKPKDQLKSFVPPSKQDGALEAVATGYTDYTNSFEERFKTEVDLINKYREMSMVPEVETAIDDIINEAIIFEDNDPPITLNMDNVTIISKSMKSVIEKEFDNLLKILDFNNTRL